MKVLRKSWMRLRDRLTSRTWSRTWRPLEAADGFRMGRAIDHAGVVAMLGLSLAAAFALIAAAARAI